MSKIEFDIISTGSEGNATVLNKTVLLDCGVSYKALTKYHQTLKLVLLTHVHSDHFNKTCIRLLCENRPALRFGCGDWLVPDLLNCGVPRSNIDVLNCGVMYCYGICNVIPVPLVHDVPNCGYKVLFPEGKAIYCTATNNLNGITALHYDLFLIEANFDEKEIQEKIREKRKNGEYAYEYRVLKNHLSRQKCDDFIYRNIGSNGEYVYMHQHSEDDS